jgi:hypothetical protein
MSNNVAITNAQKEKYLRDIREQFNNLKEKYKVRLPEFGEPKLSDKELLIALQQYLKCLPEFFPDEIRNKLCEPCDGGSCPPCFDGDRGHYERYLENLRSLN